MFSLEGKQSALMRENIDMFLLWKTVEYFQPKSALEIGFFAGQTLGLIYEAADCQIDLTSVDIDFSRRPVFQQVYPKANVRYIECSSQEINLDRTYDLIHIDGNHSYEAVHQDVLVCLPACTDKTILVLDDYCFLGVSQAIRELLLGQSDFVPFMRADQQMYFHHRSHSCDQFLDEWIQDRARNFIYFQNIDFGNFVILEAKLPNIFVENRQMFHDALKFYNL